MHSSRFAMFLGVMFSLVIGLLVAPIVELGRAFIRFDHADHRASLELDRSTREIDALPIAARFMAFLKRCLEHDLFTAGRFDVARSTAT